MGVPAPRISRVQGLALAREAWVREGGFWAEPVVCREQLRRYSFRLKAGWSSGRGLCWVDNQTGRVECRVERY